MKNKGFTLIELLVVIAIIGILSSVVLASLNSARSKGSDAAVKSNLDNARAQAELFYDSNTNSYSGVCATTGTNVIGPMVASAAAAVGGVTVVANGTAQAGVTTTGAVCHDSATAWVASSPLKNQTTGSTYWCVDSTGKSTAESSINVVASGATACL